MLKLLLKWLLSATALLAVAYLYGGVEVSGFGAAMFYAASGVIDGFAVRSFGAALIGSIMYSVAGVVIDSALEGLRL